MKKLLFVLAGIVLAASALAALTKYKDWEKSPEAYFLTSPEREEWKKVATDEEAEKFVVVYFAKRGGEPFKEALHRRITAADEQFKMRRQKGSESARGRVFIVLGSPSRVQQARPVGSADIGATPDRLPAPGAPEPEARTTAQIWIYEKGKFDASWGLEELSLRFNFDPQRGTDEFDGARDQAAADKAIAVIVAKSIVNPDATAVAAVAPKADPAAAAAAPAPAAAAPKAAPAAPAAAPTMPLPAAVQSALEGVAGKTTGEAGFWSGAFRSVAGDSFLALQFYLPANKPAFATPSPLKFGGIVTDEAGKEVDSFWEDAVFSEVAEGARKDRVFDRSVTLQPGSYKGVFGLFPAEGQPPVASASVNFKLDPRSTDFGVSPLILSNGLVALTKRPRPADPFVFGVEKPIKVEPKGDHTFSKTDSLWYFYGVENPGVPVPAADAAAAPAPSAAPAAGAAPAPAADAPKPRIMTRINVQRDGQDAFAPFTGPAELVQTSPGFFSTGSEIPLASFEPGYYTFMITVRDLNAARGSTASKGIERKEDFVVLMPDGSLPPKAKPAAAPAPKPKKP